MSLDSQLGSIRPLSPAAAAQISSSAQLTSLNEVVAALVQNSLDATATRLRVALDYSRGSCSVEDDGTGILSAEFSEAGGLGKPFHTSRQSDNECHGFKGNFIASLATLAVVTITSHHRSQTSQNSMILHRGKTVVRNTPSLASERLLEYPHGTCVSVRDLFGSMPVRVRQRAVASADVTKQWTSLVWTLTSLLISWPTGVALNVQAASSISEGFTSTTTSLMPRRISFKPVDSTTLAVRTPKLLAQAKLADSVQWEPISATSGPFFIKGCIAHAPVASRRAQFISIGVVPIANNVETSALYNEINKVFADSAFSCAQDEDDEMLKFAGFAGPAKRSMKRYPERWPMFYFKIITAERLSIDQLFGSQKMLSMLTDLLKAVCTEYLKRSGYKTTTVESDPPVTKKLLSSRTQNAIKSSSCSAFSHDKWGRMKQGRASIPKIDPRSFPKMPLVSNSGNLTRPPFEVGAVSVAVPKSMKQLASTWENPVFKTTSPGIPQLAPVTSSSASGPSGGPSNAMSFDTVSIAAKSSIYKTALLKARVLRQVDNKFILVVLPKDTGGPQAQPELQTNLLAIIDQHAADERIRLEELMASYFPASPPGALAFSEPVTKDISFSLPEEEIGLLLRYRKHLNAWGITYDIRSPSSLPGKEITQAIVTISTIPPAIHARCVQDPQLIISAIRAELWSLADSGHSTGPRLASLDAHAAHPFIPRFRTCPAGILDLLHSRACRSAVMFNDELSLAQCEDLIQRLASCAFPFQCAHGRPSMVPLLDLGNRGEGGLWVEYSKTPRDMWTQYLKR